MDVAAAKVVAIKEVVATMAVVVMVGVSAGNLVSLINVDCKQACWDAITVCGINDGHDSEKHSGNVTKCCHSRHA